MNKFIYSVLFLLVSLSGLSQTQRPSGNPSPNSPTGFSFYGWSRADSGFIWGRRDTFPAKYPTTVWHPNGNFYKTTGSGASWSLFIPSTSGTVSNVMANNPISVTSATTTPIISLDTTFSSSGVTTRGRTKQQIDSLSSVKLNISDSLSGGYTSWLLTKKKVDSLGLVISTADALKKNIADTFFTTGYTTRARTKQQTDSISFLADDYRVHIKDFGADSTGVTNSTVPILNAIAEAKLRGAALVIDPGTYWISQALPISNYHKEIIGYNSTIRQSGNDEIFFISDCDNLSIKGVKIVGNKQSLQTGVYATGSNQMDIDIRFDSLFQAVYIDQTQASTPPYEQNNMVRVIGGRSVYGVFLNSSAEYVTVHNSIIHDIDSIGVWISGGNNGVVGTTIHGSNIGIYVQGTFAPNSDHGRIVGNVINHYETCGILLEYLRFSHVVSGNDIWAAGSGNLYGTGKSFGIYIKKSGGATITSNTIASNPISIGLDSSDFNNISSNSFINFLGLTDVNIKEYGSLNSYNNTITTNNFVAVSGSKVDSVVMLSGSSIGGTSYVGRQTIHNQFGGTTSSNYLEIKGATANNLNYPGLQLTGGTLATTYPNLRLLNGGLGISARSGTAAAYPGISEIRMDATEGFVVANNTTGNPAARFQVELSGRLRAYNVDNGATTDDILTITTDTIRRIPSSLFLKVTDTTLMLSNYARISSLGNYAYRSSGLAELTGAAFSGALLGTTASFTGNANADSYDLAAWDAIGYSGSIMNIGGITTGQWQYIDFYTGGSHRARIDNTGVTYLYGELGVAGGLTGRRANLTSLILNKDSVPITSTNIWALMVDTASGRVNRYNLNAKVNLSDTAAILNKVTFDRALSNGSTSGRSFTSGAATLLGTRNNTPGTVNLNLSSTAGYGFRINTYNELVLDAFNGATWAEAHKWALGGASFNYSRFYGTSMVLNKDSVPITTTNTQVLTVDTASGRIQRNTVTSGIYLPTAANVSNTSDITIDTAQFMRVGNVVTVSGRIAFTNTLNSPSQISITLPVATIVSSERAVAGTANENIAEKIGIIRCRTGTNDALLEINGLNTSTYTVYYTYTYRIL